jgi:2-methylisocitrate lyase-like PEP mutase family enzyme
VREFERAGAAAVTLEDLETKKRGLPIPVDEMVQRLHAALDARRDESFSIIARTDASAPWRSGLRDDVSGCENDAFERCAAYAEAGADLVMPQVLSANWVEKFGNQITAPILFRGGPAIGGASDLDPRTGPPPSLEELESWNVKVLAYTPALLFRAFSYYRRQLAECLEAGGFVSSPSDDADRIEAQSVALKMA